MRVSQYIKHDRLDDEVMVIDLDSGAYFAFTGAAADAWSLLATGQSVPAVGAAVAERYGVDATITATEIHAFAGDLVLEGLLADGDSAVTLAPELAATPGDYVAPHIKRFEELADLLLLDPVHEVEPAGWPIGRGA